MYNKDLELVNPNLNTGGAEQSIGHAGARGSRCSSGGSSGRAAEGSLLTTWMHNSVCIPYAPNA